jgi:hypothetical protein
MNELPAWKLGNEEEARHRLPRRGFSLRGEVDSSTVPP